MRKTWKVLTLIVALMLAFCLVACGSSSEPAEEASSAASAASAASGGIANPWQTAETLEEAVKGAGLDSFTFEEGMETSLGPLNPIEYRYSPGIVDIYTPVAAVELTIRKGDKSAVVEDDDISGDYNEYKHHWTQSIKGLEVDCFGNREGEATKTIWHVDNDYYSILAFGAGGDDDFGLSADDLNTIINGIQ